MLQVMNQLIVLQLRDLNITAGRILQLMSLTLILNDLKNENNLTKILTKNSK